MPIIVVVALAPLAVACAAGCDRAETDRNATASAAVARPDPTVARETAPQPQPKTSGCIVPMSSTPAPIAKAAANCANDPDGPPTMPHGWVTFRDAAGKPRVAVELARTPDHREHGLMYRTNLGDDEGMLFSWSDESYRSFWMHNTCLPLDMLFIGADGTIVGILEQVPVLNDEPRSVPCRAAHVLELHAGWARGHGVQPGQHIDIET